MIAWVTSYYKPSPLQVVADILSRKQYEKLYLSVSNASLAA